MKANSLEEITYKNMLLKKNYTGVEDEKEEVSSYWMILRKWIRTGTRKRRSG